MGLFSKPKQFSELSEEEVSGLSDKQLDRYVSRLQKTLESDKAAQAAAKIRDSKMAFLKSGGESQLDVSSLGNKVDPSKAAAGKTAAIAQGVDMAAKSLGVEETSTAGGVTSGVAQGAQMGAALGPKGALIGAAIGGIAGGLSARSKRKERERQANAEMYSKQGQIQQSQGIAQSNILQGLANNLSQTLV